MKTDFWVPLFLIMLVTGLCAVGAQAQSVSAVGQGRTWGLIERLAWTAGERERLTLAARRENSKDASLSDVRTPLGSIGLLKAEKGDATFPGTRFDASARHGGPAAPQRSGGSSRKRRTEGEVYFGVGYANLDIAGFAERRHSVGWGASITGYFTRYFGITGDFAGVYNPKCPQNDLQCFVELLRATEIRNYSAHQFLAGPRLRIPGYRFNGFVHALFGGARSHARLLTVATGQVREFNSGPDFAMAFGGGLDWNVTDRVAVRLLQVDYIPVRESASAWRHNVRFQGGVVFRWGGTR